jgi:predicted nucleotidyltransferase
VSNSRQRSARGGAVLAPRRDGESACAPTDVLIEVARASEVPAGTALYLFGSSCRGEATANDIDVLLVYPNGHLDQAHLLAESVRKAPTSLPFDVLALSAGEERELAFIQTERATRIWSR